MAGPPDKGRCHATGGGGSHTSGTPGRPLGPGAPEAHAAGQPTQEERAMKVKSRVVAVSWIPSEAVKGAMKAPFELGLAHYDEPLPDVLGDLEEWAAQDLFR